MLGEGFSDFLHIVHYVSFSFILFLLPLLSEAFIVERGHNEKKRGFVSQRKNMEFNI